MIAAALVAALGGCSTTGRETGAGDPFLGEAVRYNAAVQTINPDPVYTADMAKPGDNGEKGAEAVKRYRTDNVKPVQTMETTAGSTGSSAGSRPPR
ncbi:MAG: hypothetical protein ACREBK_06625 [Sphingomicrobium sp.]